MNAARHLGIVPFGTNKGTSRFFIKRIKRNLTFFAAADNMIHSLFDSSQKLLSKIRFLIFHILLADLKEKMSVFGLTTKIPMANFTMLVMMFPKPTAAAISSANVRKKGQLFAPCLCVTHYHFLLDLTNVRICTRISTHAALDSSAMMS